MGIRLSKKRGHQRSDKKYSSETPDSSETDFAWCSGSEEEGLKEIWTMRDLEMCRIICLTYFWKDPLPPSSKCWLDQETLLILEEGDPVEVRKVLSKYMSEIYELMGMIRREPLDRLVDQTLIYLKR